MYLIFDTETTGFPHNVAPDHPTQSRIMQIACMILDEHFKCHSVFKTLLRPDRWPEVHTGAFAAHGLTKEVCESYGIPAGDAIDMMDDMAINCEYLVAHNLDFDNKMLNIERALSGRSNTPTQSLVQVCTMKLTTPLCRLPPTVKWAKDFKWPKLEEALKILLNDTLDSRAHDALADVQGCAKLLKYLRSKQNEVAVQETVQTLAQ